MSEPRQTDAKSSRSLSRVNPFALAGVLILVVVSVSIGIFGPKISQRGDLAVGIPLMDLLGEAHALYDRAAREAHSSLGMSPQIVRRSRVEHELSQLYGETEVAPDLEATGFEPVSLDASVRLQGFSRRGLAIVYEERAGLRFPGEPQAVVMLLYLPFKDDIRGLYARNDLGVPVSIASGSLFVRRVSVLRGQDLWSATWRGSSVIHVLIAPSERILDALIDSMGLSKPAEDAGSRLAGSFSLDAVMSG